MKTKKFPFLFFLFLFSCSPALRQQESIVQSYRLGNVERAEVELTEVIQKEMPKGNYRQSGNAVWLLLDRATTRFAIGRLEEAVADYAQAFDAIDYYTQDSTVDLAAELLFSDTAGAYCPWDYEQILCRVYFALALMEKGDFNNAYALLRNAEEWQQKQRYGYSRSKVTQDLTVPDNALVKYLLALLSEKQGDFSNAQILYKEVTSLTNGKIAYEPTSLSKDLGTLLLICHNGHAPQKVSEYTDAHFASSLALEMLLASSNVAPPALSSFAAMPTLTFHRVGPSPIPVAATLENQQKMLQCLCNIENLALWEAKKKEPIFLAKAIARFAMRRVAVGYCQQQDPLLGVIADIGMTFANTMTTADTRAWNTLPSRVDCARFDLPPGRYQIQITLYKNAPFYLDVEIKPSGLNVINLFV